MLPTLAPWYLFGGTFAFLVARAAVLRVRRGGAEDFAPLDLNLERVCDPRVRPGVNAFRRFVLERFGGYDAGIVRECSGALSGHTAGLAWDWGVDNRNAPANVSGMLDFFLRSNAEEFRRAGLTYLIFNRQIWNSRDRRWSAYTGSDPHTSHIHVSFSPAGANGQTSFYRGLPS